MAIDWDFKALKKKAGDKYNNDYLSGVASTYGNMGGRINFDQSTGVTSYQGSSRPLPSLPSMWNDYSNGAKARGAVPDFLTFKKYYGELKQLKNQQIIKALQRAQLEGISMDKIHDAIKLNPGFRDEIVQAISNTTDENMRANLASYVPPIEKSFGQLMTPGTILGLGATGLAASNYLGSEVLDDADNISRRQRVSNIGAAKEYIKNNPRPIAVNKADFRTADGSKFKANGAKNYKSAQAEYKAKLDAWKKNAPKGSSVNQNVTRSSQISKWANKKGIGGLGTTALAFAPTVAGIAGSSLGLNKKDNLKLQGTVAAASAAGLTTQVGVSAFNVMKAAPKGGALKALSSLGIVGKVATTLFLAYQAYSSFSQAKTTQKAADIAPKTKVPRSIA